MLYGDANSRGLAFGELGANVLLGLAKGAKSLITPF
jgi:hypothetical protein